MTISIAIVDDHPVISHGLIHILGKEDDFSIVGHAIDGAAARKLAEKNKPEVIILDISLEGSDGISLIPQLVEESGGGNIIMYTTHNNKSYIVRSLKAGALGYVLKSDKTEELVLAVRDVVQKKMYLSKSLSPSLLGEIIVGNISDKVEIDNLTTREYEVASLIAQGRSIDQIGEDLFISPKTVRVHRTNIMHKFTCKNVHELLLQLRQHFPQ